MKRRPILIVEDDLGVAEMLKEWLEEEGYDVRVAGNARQGLRLFYDVRPVLTVVDLVMPGMDGFQLISRIRELSDAHILILSALGSDEDVVRGLDLGADEYLVKPVSRAPFLARVRSLLRRANGEGLVQGYADDLITLDPLSYTVTVEGRPVHLSPLEFRLLAYFVRHRNRVIPHGELLREVWEHGEGSPDSLKWYVSSLRRKLGEASPEASDLIQNVRGLGYRYSPPGEAPQEE